MSFCVVIFRYLESFITQKFSSPASPNTADQIPSVQPSYTRSFE